MKLSSLVSIQRWWLFLLIVAIPLSTGYIVDRPIAISWVNVLSIVFILLGLVNGIRGAIPFRTVKDRGTVMTVALFFAALAYALLFTHPLRNGIGLWGSRLVQPALVGYFAYLMLEAGALRVSELAAAFLATLVPQIIGGALQVLHVIPYQDSHRVTVAYRWPNTFARYAMAMLVLAFPWLVAAAPARFKGWGWAVWGAGILVLLGSISYNGTVSFLVALAVGLVLLPKAYGRLKWAGLGLLAAAVIIVAPNLNRLPKWQTSITDSRETRLEFWRVAAGTIRDNPWTGIGIKGWETRYTDDLIYKYGTPPYKNYASPQPHDFFLDSLLKGGIPGLIGITPTLAWPVVAGLSLLRRRPFGKEGWWGLAAALFGISLLCFGLIDDPLWSDDMVPLVFLVLAGLAYLRPLKAAKGRKD